LEFEGRNEGKMKGGKNERKDGWMDGKRREKRMGEICIICIGAVTKLFTHDDVRNFVVF
jgi:hypothetical protein